MRYDEKRQISRLIQSFVAKSNATQRRGRAGRVRSGLCFHLFSSVRHSKMAEHPLPEMLRLSLSDLALRIKIMKVNLGTSIQDVLSRALDPPSTINIQRAVAALVEVKALTETEEITPMGRLLSKLPTDVHLGKFLLVAALFKCLDPALTVAATLNSKSPFITPFGLEQEAERAKAKFASGSSDFLTIHNAFASFRRASANPGFIRKFCRDNYLSQQNLQQIEELRQQFLGYLIDSSFIKVDTTFSEEFRRARYSRQRNTRFVTVPPEYDANTDMEDKSMCLFNAALASGLYPKLLNVYSSESSNGQSMKMLSNNQAAFFHPSSVNFGRRPGDLGAGYLMYFTIVQSKRLYAWETAPVDDLALVLLCGDAEFKLISNTIDIDRKIKYRVAPKTNVALKHLREHLLENLSLRFKGKELSETQKVWETLAIKVLGRVKSIET
ncbi:P-loop containing nucleoside triphosphate hydrolase protein [Schizopora paradoxa]|uniref:p-loop containing nucleoside triphosphate hydrolase protein n=1 Tax=Schizopora paradoxa TaxID=27342 RepID=A0A0H2S8G0_9AGAM|nr:P-loop containing nucleoside triphosphate hydrolase protein [Schizopora paradoxa]